MSAFDTKSRLGTGGNAKYHMKHDVPLTRSILRGTDDPRQFLAKKRWIFLEIVGRHLTHRDDYPKLNQARLINPEDGLEIEKLVRW